MNRKNWDYKKYGGYLNPDSDIFFGPVTIRELKKSEEMAKLLIEERRRKNKIVMEPICEVIENHELNRTFDLTENDENVNIRPNVSELDSVYDKNTKTENHSSPSIVHMEPLKDISNRDGILASTFEDLKINESLHNLSNISINSIKNLSANKKGTLLDDTLPTLVQAYLQTPLIVEKTLTNENSNYSDKPRVTKLSNTFITELLPQNCLINTSLNDGSTGVNIKNENTPEIFQHKHNDIWAKNNSIKKSMVRDSFKSKLPQIRKTPNEKKYLYAKSPVADYIYRGLTVQSMSKLRHSHCIANISNTKSKSESKIAKPCKIPVSLNAAAKRKLKLGEIKPSKKESCLELN